MSDLLTPLQWSPRERDGTSVDTARASIFAWPMPPFPSYPAVFAQQLNEACEIVGLNDRRMLGRLISFVPDERIAHVQIPPARTTIALRFKQFKSLTVLPPVAPEARVPGDDPHAQMLSHRPRSRYRVSLVAGDELQGTTLGHVENEHGLFLFPPLDADDGPPACAGAD